MTYPVRRRSRTGSVRATSSPSISTRPPVGSTSRLIIRRVVDLPQPEGPTRASTSPGSTTRLSDPTATVPSGYSLRTASSSMRADTTPTLAVPAGGAR